MKAIENVREKANQVINRYGKVIFTFLIFFTLLGTAQVAEAQSGLKINSLSEVTDKDQSDAEYRRQNVFGYVQNGVRTLFGFVCHFG